MLITEATWKDRIEALRGTKGQEGFRMELLPETATATIGFPGGKTWLIISSWLGTIANIHPASVAAIAGVATVA